MTIDREIVLRMRQGSAGALDAFFDCYFARVYAYVATLVHDRQLAEDLTQEAFVRVHRGLDSLDVDRDPTPWVFTVVTNTVRDYWRSRQHKISQRQVDLDVVRERPATDDADPLSSIERQERATAVRAALKKLSDPDREVILLRNYEMLETKEISAILGITPEAVRQRHSRAVERLGREYRTAMTRDLVDR